MKRANQYRGTDSILHFVNAIQNIAELREFEAIAEKKPLIVTADGKVMSTAAWIATAGDFVNRKAKTKGKPNKRKK